MNSDKFILGDHEICMVDNILISIRPAEGKADHARFLLDTCEKREERGFVSGLYNFGILMGALRELDQDKPIEISMSVENIEGRARLLKIIHDGTTIYLAGMTQFRSGLPPEPDALTHILQENEVLRERIAELELRAGGWL
jgi:hypothetical protein